MKAQFLFALLLVCAGSLAPWNGAGAAESLDPWQLRFPLPMDAGLYDVTYGQGRFVAVGGATMLVSPDGLSWSRAWLGPTNDFRTVAHGQAGFVAMGVAQVGINWSSEVGISNDGSAWNLHLIDDFQIGPPVAVTYGAGVYAMVSQSGICISTNGLSWVNVYSNLLADLEGIAYGNGRFVAVGRGSVTSTNGIVWISFLTDTNYMAGVAFGNGTFVALGESGPSDQVLTSADGAVWIVSSAFTNRARLSDICFGQGGFVICGSETASAGANWSFLTSTNASTWTKTSSPSALLRTVAYGGATVVAVGSEGAMATLVDGQFWTSEGANPYRIGGITYGKGTFAVPAFDKHLTSSDGVKWTTHDLTIPFKLGDATFVGDRFFAVSKGIFYNPDAINGMAVSADGTNWEPCMMWTNGTSEMDVSLPAYGRGAYVAVGSGFNNDTKVFTAYSFVSANGRQWEAHALTNKVILLQVVHAGNRFVAVGWLHSGAAEVFSSPDGISWKRTWSGPSMDNYPLGSLAFGNGTFVTATMGGFLVSHDGDTWTAMKPGFDGMVYDVAYGDGLFVAAGAAGTVLISEDGDTWTDHNIGTYEWLYGITCAQGTFAAATLRSIYQSARSTLAGFRLGSPHLLSSGAAQIPLDGGRGRSWEAQASADLHDWTTIAAGTSTNGIAEIIDTNAASFPRRFYRAVTR